MSEENYSFATRAIHVGQEPDPVTGAVIPPISLATTFKQKSAGVHTVSFLNSKKKKKNYLI